LSEKGMINEERGRRPTILPTRLVCEKKKSRRVVHILRCNEKKKKGKHRTYKMLGKLGFWQGTKSNLKAIRPRKTAVRGRGKSLGKKKARYPLEIL